MGWTVLYIAFGIVALWLLGEVLLQYKARLRWRLLAFAGFACVVVGVLMPSVFVIAVGAIAFATGQTYVTLSFRRGFSTGWAIGGSPGESRRRRAGGARDTHREPTLEVSDLEMEYDHSGQDEAKNPAPASAAAVYEPEPLPDDTGQYGIYTDPQPAHQSQQAQPQYASYEPYPDYSTYTAPAPDSYAGQDSYGGQGTYASQDSYAGQYDYGTDRQQYAAYSDPYIGTTTGSPQYGAQDPYASHDSYGGQQQFTADPYAQQYASETPPGGVWVPQQREGEQYPPLPPEQPAQPAPFPNGYDTGYNDQYRY
ncbi:hypothetical protein OHA79_15320 [Streptomyces sp. NBC_00841]|uniref:hypothetical protein n=1 Tax=unclassified Streptomyces TaxID=2593676 RepID=UPI002253B7BC|nr:MULTISPECIES: hypothetical protein [unclassified Streptomyces]MCX4535632.1 hypothetical protein [Streptomyces sp. NBC_01669]WRZ99082.1 hypothetical protein OHA79_15320 [Streptomyces sp. NBC_00841]